MPLPLAIRLAAILSLWTFPTDHTRAEVVDVAARGIATQTSEWNGGQQPAALAIDGDPSTFSHTDGATANNAWSLRLDQEYEIASVELAMRADCCGGRLTGTG